MIDPRLKRPVVLAAFAVLLLVSACGSEEDPKRYVARVGDRYLLQEDVERQLATLPSTPDSAVARQQIIEQWVTNELLYQEAHRKGLQNDKDVRHLLAESERTVLVNALLEDMYEQNGVTPSPAEMQSYYERHKEQLRLREGFVRVRYVETRAREDAEAARSAIETAAISQRDSVWNDVISRFAVDSAVSKGISEDFYPESRVFAGRPLLRDALNRLVDGQASPVIEFDSTYVVIQLAQRVPAQTIPEPEWIEEELARRLVIQGRKQLYARQVQRLRNEALAREDLDVP